VKNKENGDEIRENGAVRKGENYYDGTHIPQFD